MLLKGSVLWVTGNKPSMTESLQSPSQASYKFSFKTKKRQIIYAGGQPNHRVGFVCTIDSAFREMSTQESVLEVV
jgi:hypothetical protein